jgi:aminopeptidase N
MTATLTRTEAAERSRLLRIDSYRVELDLTGDRPTFSSATTVSFRCTTPGAPTFIDLTAVAVGEITLNGAKIEPGNFDGDRIRLQDLGRENELRVAAECSYSLSGEGLHRFTDPVDGAVYLYSNLETSNAHRVYACFDQPDLKASYELSVLAPPGWEVISNMAPDVAGAAAGPARRWHFPASPTMSTYVTAIAAGPYHVARAEHDGIDLGIGCRQSLARYLDPDEIFEVTRNGFGYFHEAFGVRYQFGKYDQLFVPEFKAGAMENVGCVMIREDYVFRSRVTESRREVRAQTILHEMAHMWFGNLVTMRWWDDLWLSESFATWAGTAAQAEATRWREAWTTFAQFWKALAYQQDQLSSTHPISADIPDVQAVEVNFDGITYAKGAAVLRQLVAYVGRDNFLDGVRGYLAKHSFGNASLSDLLMALEEASGRDLATWSRAWLETAGVNTLAPSFATGADGRFTSFAVVQGAPVFHPVLRPHRVAIGLYDRDGGRLTRRLRVEADLSGERTWIPELVGERRPELVMVNDDDLSYAKMTLDDRSLRTLTTGGIGEFTDSLPASLCWAATWEMCRDAEMRARDYVRLVLSGVDSVRDIMVRQIILRQAAEAARRFADPAWRREGLALTSTTVRQLLETAAPGSDFQLAYAQAFGGVASSAEDLDLLAGLLDGARSVEGLPIDTELRWRFLHRLVSRGLAGPAEISAELARDSTDVGQRYAATCRAAIPEPIAKEVAWTEITSGDLSAAALRAALTGFQDLDQEGLLAPYAARFFDVVAAIWQEWTPTMAQQFVQAAYPISVITHEAIDAADSFIENANPAPALRRLLAEGRDDTERALRCRQRDVLRQQA